MSLFNNALNLFGLQVKKASEGDDKNDSGALSVGLNDDGSAVSVATSVSLGLYLDVDGQIKSEIQAIQKYRDIALYPEVDSAIQDIINEAMPMENDTDLVKLNLDDLEQGDSVKKQIQTEFDEVLKILKFRTMASDIFRRWYVDGKVYFQIIVDKNKPQDGIKKVIPLDAVKIKKVKEIVKKRTPQTGAEVVDRIDEYFIYNENGFVAKNMNQQGSNTEGSVNQGLKISTDAIIYVTSGYVDQNTGMTLSYLHKAIRPINQLRMLEDATVVYFIARAPERRVFYVDVGNLPKLKAEQYLKDIMNRYRNKMVYDARTGDVRDDKKYMSMLEDFWMPRRDGGKGTEVSILPGAQNVSGYLDSLDWFKEKMYEALNVPKSRFQSEDGFSLGRSSEISRDELKFQKFVDRLRVRYGELLLESLRTQLMLKGLVNTVEWELIKDDLRLDWQKDNYFTEFKEQEMLTARLTLLQQADAYIGKYYDYEWVMKNIMKFDDDEIEERKQKMDAEKDDPRAQNPQQQQMDMQQQQMEQQQQQQADAASGGAEGFPPQQDGSDTQGAPEQQEQPKKSSKTKK